MRRIPRPLLLPLLLVVVEIVRGRWDPAAQWTAFGIVLVWFGIAWFLNWRHERQIRRDAITWRL